MILCGGSFFFTNFKLLKRIVLRFASFRWYLCTVCMMVCRQFVGRLACFRRRFVRFALYHYHHWCQQWWNDKIKIVQTVLENIQTVIQTVYRRPRERMLLRLRTPNSNTGIYGNKGKMKIVQTVLENIQTVLQTVYKPSYKPCTDTIEKIQTVKLCV